MLTTGGVILPHTYQMEAVESNYNEPGGHYVTEISQSEKDKYLYVESKKKSK